MIAPEAAFGQYILDKQSKNGMFEVVSGGCLLAQILALSVLSRSCRLRTRFF